MHRLTYEQVKEAFLKRYNIKDEDFDKFYEMDLLKTSIGLKRWVVRSKKVTIKVDNKFPELDHLKKLEV